MIETQKIEKQLKETQRKFKLLIKTERYRIIKEFEMNSYEKRFHIGLEKVLRALFGIGTALDFAKERRILKMKK